MEFVPNELWPKGRVDQRVQHPMAMRAEAAVAPFELPDPIDAPVVGCPLQAVCIGPGGGVSAVDA